jgi:hypothetical protein
MPKAARKILPGAWGLGHWSTLMLPGGTSRCPTRNGCHMLALRIPVVPGLTKSQVADMIDAAKAGHLLATAREVFHG